MAVKVPKSEEKSEPVIKPEKTDIPQVRTTGDKKCVPKASINLNKPYEEMSIEELQEAILGKMRKNGPVTEYMLGTVRENTHRGSLLCWVRSFN